MMKTIARLLALTTILALPTWVEAIPLPIVVDFEGLGAGVVPDGYGGINWNGDWSGVDAGGNAAAVGTTSTPGLVCTGGIACYDTFFDFQNGNKAVYGALFWAPDVPADTYYVNFELYNLGAFVHSSSLLYLSSIPTFLWSGFTNEFENVYFGAVDRVAIRTNFVGANNGPLFLMDDLTYVNKVPEPGMLLLVGLGLLGTAARARRRRI